MNIYVGSQMSDHHRRLKLYEGSLFVHSPSRSALKLCSLAQELIQEAFGSVDPLQVQDYHSAERCAEILARRDYLRGTDLTPLPEEAVNLYLYDTESESAAASSVSRNGLMAR
jgi:hypothetical protein